MATRAAIDDFLGCRRLAIVGVSRQDKDFSRAVFRAFTGRGYEAVPVNPAGGEVDGLRCVPRIADVQPPVEAALLLTPSKATKDVVQECAEAGVRRIWLHRGGGPGAVSDEAVALCRDRGLEVVDGACPFMFLPDTGFPHRVHRFFVRLAGRLPH
jgi:predicted CoA-binding protein